MSTKKNIQSERNKNRPNRTLYLIDIAFLVDVFFLVGVCTLGPELLCFM
jgi:hypothetical protein